MTSVRSVAGFDEDDVALLDAMHVNPRASFDELGRALGLSGVTVARRWNRLQEEGRAWVTSAFGPNLPMTLAFVEARCSPLTTASVAESWAAVPQVLSVNITTGDYHVYALVAVSDRSVASSMMIDVLPSAEGIQAVRCAVVSELYSDVSWRLGAIDARQAAIVAPAREPRASHILDAFDHDLFLALQSDGRLGTRALANVLRSTEYRVSRRLRVLQQSGLLRFRTDFARAEAGWPGNVALLLTAQGRGRIPEIGQVLVSWPQVRVCASIIGGPARLLVTVQLHQLAELEGLLAQLDRAYAGVEVVDARVALRAVKSFGRVLGTDGRARAVVPVNPWHSIEERNPS